MKIKYVIVYFEVVVVNVRYSQTCLQMSATGNYKWPLLERGLCLECQKLSI